MERKKKKKKNFFYGFLDQSGGPLGDPSARVFEVFLIVLNGVQVIVSQLG